ncbi:MAG: ABC transporter permease [Planctomycetota bacterium]
MTGNSLTYPPLHSRLYSIWFRHFRVYTRNLVSNGLPPFLEPLIFLVGIGLGLGQYIDRMEGVSYLPYLASGLLVTTSMYTAAFECSFATFIRLEFDKVYDGMLGASISAEDLIIGEILWAGTKGFFFSLAVLVIVVSFGILPVASTLPAPIVGFFTGIMFGAFSLFITSFVKTINHFNFYMTGFLSPMFFFSGVVFPLNRLPAVVRPLSEVLPLTHSVRLVRDVSLFSFDLLSLWSIAYILLFIVVFGYLAVVRLKKRLIS